MTLEGPLLLLVVAATTIIIIIIVIVAPSSTIVIITIVTAILRLIGIAAVPTAATLLAGEPIKYFRRQDGPEGEEAAALLADAITRATDTATGLGRSR